MNLNSKYFLGLSVLIIISIGSLFSFMIPNISAEVEEGSRLLLIGITTMIIGMIFIVLLFVPERIKGYKAEYEASPDLTHFKVVKTYPQKVPERPKLPEVAFCSSCGKQIYKPFYCAKCGQILCGTHYLPGSHTCKEEV
ncbi:MAG: AN1-type zinc finger domain-containing protein [Candidatus Hodarchaeales archaeon]|jgi:hypothetical protein